MDTIFFSKARAELAGLLDKVNDDAAAIEILRRDKPSAVLMGKDEYDSLMETIHLLSSPANAERLLRAGEEIRQGRYEPIEMKTLLGA
ncbi:type II toxin-antitoxin system prevent-host-death family antitoxin [Rhizobium sp. CECT 9324]|jgi:antitoxin YefM|uniref:type II toxin-antitoxin system Phd/YefM family antitoxin n=1 Tax=Rhizobium sp. CECT 9324 TaxID=2845820 RepID=UPI001E5B6B95|nr:type II toxin-antitoxin system prevent-host-death family antitoxin [Rhizobium sp. CECT 9324]CAH0341510.1 Antitoxin YefM [Rhizobium sp. CECT 9324]